MGDQKTHAAVTIGTFDGVHLGHQALLRRTRELAGERGLRGVVLTFPRPPQNYLGRPKKLLMPSEKRIFELGRYGDDVLVADFPKIQPLSPRQFVMQILRAHLGAAVVVVGRNFCFGRNREGNVSTLIELGSELGMGVEVVEPVAVKGEIVSSTAIREALQAGEIERANALLGRPYRLWGRVIPGEGQGRRLGIPTANVALDPEILIPAEGIYAAWVLYVRRESPRSEKEEVTTPSQDNELKIGALYIGRRPTLNGREISVEVHILDLEEHVELYGKELEMHLLARLRGDQRFDSLQELQMQIQKDIEAIQAFVARLRHEDFNRSLTP